LDIIFGYYNYDRLRSIFNNFNEDYYPIPSPGVALSEFERILGKGMEHIISNQLYKASSLSEDVISKFSHVSDKNKLIHEPIVVSIINYMSQIHYVAQE
jgi:hypothetical protein